MTSWLRASAMVVAGAVVLGSRPAMAQDDGFDAHGFKIAAQDGDPRDLMSVYRAGRFHQGEFWGTGFFEYAKAPLVLVYHYDDGRDDVRETYLDNVMALNLNVGAAAHDYLRFDLGIPLYFASTGAGEDSQGAGLGDIRLNITVPIVRPAASFGGGFGLAVVPYVDIPSGSSEKFLGQGGLTFGGRVAATFETGGLTLSGDVGPQINPSIDALNQEGAPQLFMGAGLGYLFTDTIGFGLEAHTARSLSANTWKGTASPSEAQLTMRGRTGGGFHWAAGGATGLSGGAGAAVWRGYLGIGYGKIEASAGDSDHDGIVDELDECPNEPEVINSFQDADGCADEGGALHLVVRRGGYNETEVLIEVEAGSKMWTADSGLRPAVLEVPNGSYRITAGYGGMRGARQIDVYEDAVLVIIELEADTPGTLGISLADSSGNPIAKAGLSIIGEGAPDGSLVLGPEGLAPLDLPPGDYLIFIKTGDGGVFRKKIYIRPKAHLQIDAVLRSARAKVSDGKIEVADKIFFETGSATIKPESMDLIEEIATLLIAHPEIRRVSIEGHTDSQGGDDTNLSLSQSRAESVMKAMIGFGVGASRLEAKGFGETVPIDSNDTAEGRANNRRVEFVILDG